ncbi:MAG: hypothetical protein ACR2QF_07270 [Geminicoccaceae bacterium]
MTDAKGATAPGFLSDSEYETFDFCEWEPRWNRAADFDDGCTNQAVWLVGSNGQWRLCDSCASLPKFKAFRKRTKIMRESGDG